MEEGKSKVSIEDTMIAKPMTCSQPNRTGTLRVGLLDLMSRYESDEQERTK